MIRLWGLDPFSESASNTELLATSPTFMTTGWLLGYFHIERFHCGL
jgi:hypothetical protein